MPSLHDALEAARRELLDLTLRNPLLNHRTTAARGVDVVDERPVEVYRVLVEAGRPMAFLPAPEPPEAVATEVMEPETPPVPLPDDGPAPRHTDAKLQTPYPAEVLQKRLLNTFYAARTILAEQGVNVLYLALGMLEWVPDDGTGRTRRAPLLLVPVELRRTDVRARFRLVHTGEDVGGNLSLQARLADDPGLRLPLPDPEADLDVAATLGAVAAAVDGRPGWRVDADAVTLGFFQFGKLLMFNDLDAAVWPEDAPPTAHPTLAALLGEGFPPAADRIGEDEPLDPYLDPAEVRQVVDADSSQSLALLDVRQGHHLVVQGPPGTGKSQTITNLIAEAVGAGQTVLFVAEKMAALEVVKRRLDAVHLGDACLELHSHKTTKKDLLAELQRTLALGRPRSDALGADLAVLVDTRDRLNAYAAAVNAPVGATGVTPHAAYGHLLREAWGDVRPPDDLDRSMEAWTAADRDRRRARVEEMQALVAAIGPPPEHPFWGSRRRAFLPTEAPRVADAARAALAATDALADRAAPLAEALRQPADTPADAEALVRSGRRALDAPDLRGVAADDPAWHTARAALRTLLDTGAALTDLLAAHDAALLPAAWEADVLQTRAALAAHGDKWTRWFIGDWRRAKAHLAGLMRAPLPPAPADRVALADAILEAQRLRRALADGAPRAAALFGARWAGERSDWADLRPVADWLAALHADVADGALPPTLPGVLADRPDPYALRPLVDAAEAALHAFTSAAAVATERVDLDVARRFGEGAALREQPLGALADLFRGWRDHTPRLQELVAFNHLADALFDDDLALFVGLATEWPHAPTHLAQAFDHVWFATLLDTAYVERPALARFDGALHDEALRRFADRDRLALEGNRAALAHAHWDALPRHGADGRGVGQLGTLRHEFSKKSRHKPIRRLMTEAGRAVQAIKPVFMMSPMSIAAYLPPGAVEFDLVVFDEASQVKPVDAFGALLRARQAVVVGDSKQLPPTSFFEAVLAEGDGPDDSETRDVESILELFKARQAPERMLGWHYRSRHESLIAISNRAFYDGKLVVFPSPDAERADVGLVLHPLPDAVYDRGGTQTNPVEARAVAEAVMAHARATPDRTLLVATFSQAQQHAVRDEVERLRREAPELEPFFDSDVVEPFEVKNLENVQGDERDVVFLSVGYGPDAEGRVSMNFGPLNRDGGERRLNVLITRARRRCEVFTSLRADDLDLSRTDARGVAVFRAFLRYAETGVLEGAARDDDDGPLPPFEAAVAAALREAGHAVAPRVGLGGFRVDLAVVDPAAPGRYLLGVLCDGPGYASARTARDRDRIRQGVLEGLGWRIHRVWSTDWFRDPARQLARVEAAIAQAAADPDLHRERPPTTATAPLDRDAAGPPAEATVPTVPYVLATPRAFTRPLPEVAPATLARAVADVVRVESPVHVDEVARRLLDASEAQRLGGRIREAIEGAVAEAVAGGEVVRRGDVLALASQRPADVVPRDRSALPDASRQFALIAPEEVEAAIREVISSTFGIAPADLPAAVGRTLGFAQTGPAMRTVIEGALADLQSAGVVGERAGQLVLTGLDGTEA